MVSVVVIYTVKTTQQDTINTKDMKFQNVPMVSPTRSPITSREASGIVEQIEQGILYVRGEIFSDMPRYDPRLLALDWILHKDAQLLDSDEVNLYQRYALAVLAFAMDSKAWFACGDPGNCTMAPYGVLEFCPDVECYDPTDETPTTFLGMHWLTSAHECTWYGVTCSADQVVRAIE